MAPNFSRKRRNQHVDASVVKPSDTGEYAETKAKENRGLSVSDRLQQRLSGAGGGRRNKERSWIIVACAIGLIVAAKCYQILISWMSPTFEEIDTRDVERVRTVVYGGDPWLVNCNYPVSSKDKGGPRIHPVLQKTGRSLTPKVKLATIDCSAILPSGKTVLERFKLPKDCTGFVASNGVNPKSLTPWAYREDQNLRDFVLRAILPNVSTVSSKAAFQRDCLLTPRPCLIVGRKNGVDYKARQDYLSPILENARLVRAVGVDTLKYQIKLDDELLKTGVSQAGKRFRDSQGYVVVCLINVSNDIKKTPKDNRYIGKFFIGEFKDVPRLTDFAKECASAREGSASFRAMKFPPELSWRSTPKSSSHSNHSDSKTSDRETAENTGQNWKKDQELEHNSENLPTDYHANTGVPKFEAEPDSRSMEDDEVEEIDVDDL